MPPASHHGRVLSGGDQRALHLGDGLDVAAPRRTSFVVGMHSCPDGPVYGYAAAPIFGGFASSNFPPRESERKSKPAFANSSPKKAASSGRLPASMISSAR